MPKRYFDFVAKDKDDKVVLVGEVKTGTSLGGAVEQLKRYLATFNGDIPFGLVADSQQIRIFKWMSNGDLSHPVFTFNTEDALRLYEPKFSEKQITSTYLTTLVEAWLRDLAYHWKSDHPPASEQIAEIGLLALLSEGTTEEEIEANFDSVY